MSLESEWGKEEIGKLRGVDGGKFKLTLVYYHKEVRLMGK